MKNRKDSTKCLCVRTSPHSPQRNQMLPQLFLWNFNVQHPAEIVGSGFERRVFAPSEEGFCIFHHIVASKSTIMSSVECLRMFVIERLTVAAEEIFRVFQQKIDGYEDEVEYQRRLVESVWRPKIKLHRTGMYNCNKTKSVWTFSNRRKPCFSNANVFLNVN